MIKRRITFTWHDQSDPRAVDEKLETLCEGAKANYFPHGLVEAAIDPPTTTEVLKLEEGDHVVIYCEEQLAEAELERLQQTAQEEFPEHKVLVVAKGLQLAKATKAELEEMMREIEEALR